jgi:hypothetical protein
MPSLFFILAGFASLCLVVQLEDILSLKFTNCLMDLVVGWRYASSAAIPLKPD